MLPAPKHMSTTSLAIPPSEPTGTMGPNINPLKAQLGHHPVGSMPTGSCCCCRRQSPQPFGDSTKSAPAQVPQVWCCRVVLLLLHLLLWLMRMINISTHERCMSSCLSLAVCLAAVSVAAAKR